MQHELDSVGSQRSASRADAVFRAVSEGVATFAADDLVITSVNPSVTQIFGYEAEALLGQPISTLLDSDGGDGPGAVDTHALDLRGKRVDGTSFRLEMTIVAADVQSDPFYVATFRDVTERREVERMKDEFIANLTHELHTPLAAIVGALDMLTMGVARDLSEEAKRITEIGARNSRRLMRLVNDILDHTRPGPGTLTLDMRPHGIAEIVREAVHANQPHADRFGVSLGLADAAADVSVFVDRDRLMQVMADLLTNAAKFSPEGGTVTVDVTRGDADVEVSVSDHGAGIPVESQGRVFDQFYQVDSSSTRGRGGSGLGLSICKALVEQFRGQITLDSRVAAGTTVRVTLPEHDADTPGAA
ncbi:HAMP domain-containing histidine kinase [Candidatus Poribacteria bacterium]|nr:HAMP domain-containing histidine kinase [Candidatus Poribacteria bacterium]MBT5534904.1 HAMP domain-containing histidine kinase [Candidatus Poribacteria bacterium]MBT5711257.1 HAMP domain-containing histidine kinase [Candidatus Poribacteria bacterium]MBT7098164.1 HAMP domain-containing histidine kinase [Candidatus Poribacteria bacterium]MBT7806079.1 HAMP domain-containing histidine kinase [Candidatus Poribacteria bacterium]